MNKTNENQNTMQHHKELILLLLGIIGQILVFVVSNVVGAVFSPNWIEALAVSGILLAIGLVCWLLVSVICYYLLNPKENDIDKNGILLSYAKNDATALCEQNGTLCCLSKAITLPDIHMEISPDLKISCRLYTMQEVYDIEHNGRNGSGWSDIWIFSEDISTELGKNNEAEPVVITNIAMKNTHYSMFYLDTEKQHSEIEIRKRKLLRSINEKKYKQNLKFFPLSVEDGYIGKNTLPLLCGSILFSNTKDNENTPYFTEGYLSMRKNVTDAPIYYKMPRCMLRRYAEYFKNVIKNQQEGV